eukprot:CAMPEP_0176005910 /NCGR_PEP_ID=MMETSP0120_2-20121206/2449_1 /TAXON_ID=160619 /ORGANISM="Kryptoperidinium foliaceum, Strain CCMP 1326" /LENGTH=213 /DNA_ID=CAMNT_0017338631 /DNA_START=111 /DNA_END=750 /DNA_ORIENTATION=+
MPKAIDTSKYKFGKWTEEEHQKYLDGLKRFGPQFKHISEYIGSRSTSQVRTHHQNETKRSSETPRKRKAEEEGTSAPKKPKSTPAKASPSSQKATAAKPSARSSITPKKTVGAPKSTPKKTEVKTKDILPPATVPKEVQASSISKKPVKVEPITKHAPSATTLDGPTDSQSLSKLLQKEEVQTVAAGIFPVSSCGQTIHWIDVNRSAENGEDG